MLTGKCPEGWHPWVPLSCPSGAAEHPVGCFPGGSMSRRALSQGVRVRGFFEALLNILHPWRVTHLPQASAACFFLLLLLLLPTACLRAASPNSALPGLKASPAAFYWVGVRRTPVHLLLSGASENLSFILTEVLLAAAPCREG